MEKIQACLKSEKNTRHLHEDLSTLTIIILNYSRTEKLHMKLLEGLKIQTSCQVHFFRMSFRLRDSYENSGTARNTIDART